MKLSIIFSMFLIASYSVNSQSCKIVDTGQTTCYDNSHEIAAPEKGQAFYGQDAQNNGHQPAYQDNNDGTVTDLNTDLMWQKELPSDKYTYAECVVYADTSTLADYDDWRLPTIKELYSLILFSGATGMSESTSIPYIDTDVFDFRFGGSVSPDERFIDAQYATSTIYKGTTMGGNETMFGVNFVDGRIKGYPTSKDFEIKLVRGRTDYGVNDYIDNGDGTITDNATGLMWDQVGSHEGMTWEEALAWVEEKNKEYYLGYNKWRLPNAKELQSIVDYQRSPSFTNSPAISPLFQVPTITDEGGETNYPFYWTSTTHVDGPSPNKAVYICFGEALGFMEMPPNSGNYLLQDVHGAGAQRSDPKSGDPNNYPYGFGPQGDVIRITNYVRLVRNLSQTVPVEFYGFNAGQQDGYVILRWSTASESNNPGFDIEKSFDQNTFTKIGFVQGLGTTSSTTEYEFIDEGSPDGRLYYRIKQIDYDGTASYSPVLEIMLSNSLKYIVSQNYPNPFNAETTIPYDIPRDSKVELTVFNVLGNKVATLVDEFQIAGSYQVHFDGSDIPGGSHLYRLSNGDQYVTGKMLLIK